METGASLAVPVSVRKLQTTLHAKAKQDPGCRFYTLSDKVGREDVWQAAWQAVRRNGGSAGVDGETVAALEARGVGKWLGELARDWQTGASRPPAVRPVLIPKKPAGQTRPLGLPCVRDRVAQTAAALVLTPIFEADLQPEQYAYRAGRSALDAVRRVHRLLNPGHPEVVEADWSNSCGEIPPAELLRSLARRIRDGRILGWLKAWLEMAVEEGTGPGGPRRTNRARRERKGTPQGAPLSPLLSNLYMRRFLLGWKTLGYARRFGAEIANYADDFVICGRAPAEALRAAVERRLERLRLPLNARKTRCVRVPEEPVEFLGYRVGRTYRRDTGREYLGTRPSAESVRRIGRKVSELTQARDGWLDEGEMVERWNRVLLGWANYFCLGQVSPAYRAIDAPTTERLRQGLCRKHQVRTGQSVRYPDERLWQAMGLTRLRERPASLAWAKAGSRPRAPCGKTARWVRGAGRGTGVQVETEAPTLGRKPSATATPSTLDKRASPRLYVPVRGAERAEALQGGALVLEGVGGAVADGTGVAAAEGLEG